MRQARFTVTLDKASTVPVTVAYATKDGTAQAPTHYTAKSGILTFAPGERTKTLLIPVADKAPFADASFSVVLSSPTNGTLLTSAGSVLIPGSGENPNYLERFRILYNGMHSEVNGYFGPQTGANVRSLPRHTPASDTLIINEAPDYGGETVSETASFWVGLEAWNGYVSAELEGTPDWSGYNNCWQKIDTFYVPSPKNQPVAVYNPAAPADYTPEGNLPSDYPRLGDSSAPKGLDPLAAELETTYGTKSMYLMHWIIDVEGMYGFHNGDGAKTNVYINTYQRGLQESSFETVTHPCWNDWKNGGGEFGFEPLYTQGTQVYPAAEFEYGKKWSYTNAPDAEGRAIQWSHWAHKFATEQGQSTEIAASTTKARKMGDYLRYNLFDKYFRPIGDNRLTEGTGYDSCHHLINWYAAWGGEVPETGMEGTWSYRIGCSECHQGYQAVDAAYALATGGGGLKPDSPSAGDIWLGSVYRQIEMIRWLQSPEGPIAGGVTNSYLGRYADPADGRENAQFYGMHYVYTPVWHDPPSNNWVGFQTWGQGRTANLFLEVSDKTTPLAMEIRPNLEIILDKLVVWFLDNSTLTDDGSFSLPSSLSWVSTTRITGVTADKANLEGVYEYLPSLNWDGTGDYAAFWNASKVPNPNLHCRITDFGADLGVASSLIFLLLAYAKGKKNLGKYDSAIPNSSHTAHDCFVLAKELLDRIWTNHRDSVGIAIPEKATALKRLNDPVYIPASFSGTMPNGDVVAPGSTCISIRSFLKDDPFWEEVQAYISNPASDAPMVTYHRFWANAEYAISTAAMHRFFGDVLEEA